MDVQDEVRYRLRALEEFLRSNGVVAAPEVRAMLREPRLAPPVVERKPIVGGRYLRSGDELVDPNGFRTRWDRLPGRWRLTIVGIPPEVDPTYLGRVTTLGDGDDVPAGTWDQYRRGTL